MRGGSVVTDVLRHSAETATGMCVVVRSTPCTMADCYLRRGATRSNESSTSSSISVAGRLPSSVIVIQWRLFMW